MNAAFALDHAVWGLDPRGYQAMAVSPGWLGAVMTLAAAAVATLIFGGLLLGWHARLAPLFRRDQGWERASRGADRFLREIYPRLETARPGTVVEAPRLPSWPGSTVVRLEAVVGPGSGRPPTGRQPGCSRFPSWRRRPPASRTPSDATASRQVRLRRPST